VGCISVDIYVGGAVIPITTFSWDEDELSKIYKPRIDRADAQRLASTINSFYRFSKIFRPPIINLMLYPAMQFIEKPEELSRLLYNSSVYVYTIYLGTLGFKLDEIDKILSSSSRFYAILGDTPPFVIGYNYEVLKGIVESMPEEFGYPLPDLGSRSILMERIGGRGRRVIDDMEVKRIDLAFMVVSGAILPHNISEWHRSVIHIEEGETGIIRNILEHIYGVKSTYLIPSLPAVVPSFDNTDKIRVFLERFVEVAVKSIEEVGEKIVREPDRWLIYI